MNATATRAVSPLRRPTFGQRAAKDFRKNKLIYMMAVPMIAYFAIFHFWPMYGVIISFMDFNPRLGMLGSEWVGLQNFAEFFGSYYFLRLLRNTFFISMLSLLFGFPAPIILALMLNEVHANGFKRVIQTFSYLPHFISLVVVCGILTDFLSTDGVITYVLSLFGMEARNYLASPQYFRTIYVASGIWESVGWSSILYLSAITGIDQELYDAAAIDGAGRFRRMFSITLPSITPTIVTMLLLKVGQTMNVGYQKIILLYNPNTYETADVISSYVYRQGIQHADYSYAAAVDLFNAVISLTLLLVSNRISKKLTETSLW